MFGLIRRILILRDDRQRIISTDRSPSPDLRIEWILFLINAIYGQTSSEDFLLMNVLGTLSFLKSDYLGLCISPHAYMSQNLGRQIFFDFNWVYRIFSERFLEINLADCNKAVNDVGVNYTTIFDSILVFELDVNVRTEQPSYCVVLWVQSYAPHSIWIILYAFGVKKFGNTFKPSSLTRPYLFGPIGA